MNISKPLKIAGVIIAGIIVYMLLAAVLADLFIWLAGVLGIQRSLGIDTQLSKNYALVSGSLPVVIASFGFAGVLATMFKHLNCEQPGCWKLGHRHPDHGRPVCREHYHHDVAPPAPPAVPSKENLAVLKPKTRKRNSKGQYESTP
jgi:hypothetical protein